MANKKENKLVLNNSAKLIYNGQEVTVDNIKDIPTDVLAKFFVTHISKNYPFGDIVWEAGKELRARVADSEKAGEVNAALAGLATSEQAEEIVNMLNPLNEKGERTYSNGLAVMDAGDIADAGKLLYSVDLMYVELLSERAKNENSAKEKADLEAKISELENQIKERESEIEHLKTTRLQPGKANKKRKAKVPVLVVAVVLLGASLLTSLGFNIGQKVENNHLKGDNTTIVKTLDEMKEAIERIAKDNGYKAGMTDANGNAISPIQFIEYKMKEDSSELKKQVVEMKQTIRDFGFKVDDSKTLSGIVKDVYEAFKAEKSEEIATEVKGAYLHFATLLDDLGIEPEDIVDENGNVNVDKFDANVASVVETALKNADHLRQVQEKIDTTFEALKIYKTDENGNVVTDENGNPVVKKATDFASFDYAIDDISTAYESQRKAYEESIDKAVNNAFAVAKITKNDTLGSIYTLEDFESTEAAIAFLGDCAEDLRADIANYIDLIAQKQDKVDELQDKVDELQNDIDSANEEKRALENQVEDLKKKLNDKVTENTDQNGSDNKKDNENVGPVAGEEKDDSNNSGKHQDVPGDSAGAGGSQYNDDDLDK